MIAGAAGFPLPGCWKRFKAITFLNSCSLTAVKGLAAGIPLS